jgi:hypothetical protein
MLFTAAGWQRGCHSFFRPCLLSQCVCCLCLHLHSCCLALQSWNFNSTCSVFDHSLYITFVLCNGFDSVQPLLALPLLT